MNTKTKTYPYTSSMGLVELDLTENQARRGSHPGQCADDIDALVPELKEQLDKIAPDLIRRELAEVGAWNKEELKDDQQNRHRIVWLACGDICDEHL